MSLALYIILIILIDSNVPVLRTLNRIHLIAINCIKVVYSLRHFQFSPSFISSCCHSCLIDKTWIESSWRRTCSLSSSSHRMKTAMSIIFYYSALTLFWCGSGECLIYFRASTFFSDPVISNIVCTSLIRRGDDVIIR